MTATCVTCKTAFAGKVRRGMCGKCYWRARRIERGLPVLAGSLEERLRNSCVVAPSGCWEWQLFLTADGYGRINVDGKMRTAHRVSYELLVGPIPEGLVLDHLCRNRACVNPEHLEPVTRRENSMRGVAPTVLAHKRGVCDRGHAFTPENTYVRPDGQGRMCNECMRERGRRRWRAS